MVSGRLGPYELNRIYTGDCLEFSPAIPDRSIDLVVTDPPYNVGKDYGPLVDDRLPEKKYLEWYTRMATECYRVMRDGYLYISCTTNQLWTLRPIWEKVGFTWDLMCIWHGPNYANNSNTIRRQWRILYEPIMMFHKGEKLSMLNEVHGYQTDAIMRFTRPQSDYTGELHRIHPCQKPVSLYMNIIGRTPGEIVYDPFVGSGSAVMAAKSLGRQWLAFEIDPAVAGQARRRVEEMPVMMPIAREPIPVQTEMELTC